MQPLEDEVAAHLQVAGVIPPLHASAMCKLLVLVLVVLDALL